MFEILKQIWHTKTLRTRIGFTLFILLVFRLFAHIPVPGANIENIAEIMERNKLLGVFSVLTGGGLEQFSVVMMGISPYITAAIIIQLLTVVIPRLEALSKEGERGQRIINRYTRYLTVPLAFVQSYGMIRLLNSSANTGQPIISDMSASNILFTMLILTAGTVLLMWLGEQISEDGIGNGISILIFGGIVASVPTLLGPALGLATENINNLWPLLAVVGFTLVLTIFVILFTEGQHRVPITYAGRSVKGTSFSHLPIRVNQAGMIPIIFAVSLMALPNLIASFFLEARTDWIRNLAETVYNGFNQGGATYITVYFLLVLVFSFFYVSITFNPDKVAENVQRRSGFIPGIRPGKETSKHLGKISSHLTLFGGLFLAFIAVSPIIIQNFASQTAANIPMLISGAGLIIIVGVVLEIIRQINAQLVMQDYDKMY